MSFHEELSPLRSNKDISIKWSRAPQGKAIVFVHGYRGHTTATWTAFDRFLSEEPKAAGHDLIFYGYDGFGGTIYPLTNELYTFLANLFGSPSTLVTKQSRPAALGSMKPYSELVIVAHSLGAILSRWALAMAVTAAKNWVANTRLALFAPAHNGSRPGELMRLATNNMAFLRFFVTGYLYYSPLVDELAENSAILQKFQKAVKDALASPAGTNLTAQLVIHANRERVVHNAPFESDPLPAFPHLFREADHLSVCKPTRYFPAPLDALRSILP